MLLSRFDYYEDKRIFKGGMVNTLTFKMWRRGKGEDLNREDADKVQEEVSLQIILGSGQRMGH